MLFRGRRSLTLAIPLLALSMLIASANVACVATATSAPARGVVVNGPPPAPIAEQRSAPPGANSAWVNGYWHWEGARYVWIPGHWENAPPGAQWYGPKYSQNTDGRYYYEPGGWAPGGAPGGAGAAPEHAPPQNASAFH